MARRGRRALGKKPKAPKTVKVRLAVDDHDPGGPHALVRELVKEFHADLAEAEIAVVWQDGLKPDRDGHLKLGSMQKASDCHRELARYDLVLRLNQPAWATLTDPQRRALVDHELCHATTTKIPGDDGQEDFQRDERGRVVYRLRKHDLEEFRVIAERHGCWKEDIREFAEAALGQALERAGLFTGASA